MSRATMDFDIAFAEPRLSALRPQIEEVAEDLGLPERWLNDGAKGFAQVLPPEFRERLVHVGTFGRLVVHAISRRDFILMKLAALRAEDVRRPGGAAAVGGRGGVRAGAAPTHRTVRSSEGAPG